MLLYNISMHSTQMPIQQSGMLSHHDDSTFVYGVAATRSYFACSQSIEWT